jgi:hypothetical protein
MPDLASVTQRAAGAAHRLAQGIDRPAVLLAGGAGPLGSALLERFSGSGRWGHVWVLADPTQGELQSAVRNVSALAMDATANSLGWEAASPAPLAGLIVFDQPRLYNERERAFWMPQPPQLLAVATQMKAHGVRNLAVVVPHQQALLPDALKRGLASLDEQAVQGLGFERLLLVRRAPALPGGRAESGAKALAAWMLGQLRFMVPQREQPVRSVKLAAFVEAVWAQWLGNPALSAGTRVVPPEPLWEAATAPNMDDAARGWLKAPIDVSAGRCRQNLV